jgi:hypothetical protein
MKFVFGDFMKLVIDLGFGKFLGDKSFDFG